MLDLECLNEVQKNATTDTEGAVLVFAGAGSGKTRVLTHRVAYLVEEKKVSPYNILAITFTNKATNEMKERLTQMLGSSDVWVSTFHSFCTQVLFRHADRLGYTSAFSIFDDTATKRILQKILREKHLDEDKDKDKYKYHISKAKNGGMNSSQYFDFIRGTKDAMLICEVYDRYESLLKENNAMDFDDLLVKCLLLFNENEDILEHYQNRFKYIHVDEFQDTNVVQFELVKLLSKKWGNLFVVGDDDQSIYSWRGANIKNILEFDKLFENVKTYKLMQNYRSTNKILECANNLIKNNNSRQEKTLFTDEKGGVKVEYLFNPSEYKEVDKIIQVISQLKRYSNYKNKDFAILVRQNSLTRLYEINLSKAGLNYKVFGSFKFFDRKEIQDIISYLRVLSNPHDAEALGRIINFPPRGIGSTTIEKLQSFAVEKDIPLFDVITEIKNNDEFSPAIRGKVGAFTELMNQLLYSAQSMKFSEFVPFLVNTLNLEMLFKSTGKEEDENRWENVSEFLTHIQENFNDENITIEEFLHSMMLNNEEKLEDDGDFITIATMHAVKGMEFKTVFIIACEEGIIPSSRSLNEKNGVEEERRVMYVAITRARERLYISCVNGERTKFNRRESTMPSRFITESRGEEKIEPDLHKYDKNEFYDDDYSSAIPTSKQIKKVNFVPNVVIDNKPVVKTSDTASFVTGAKIQHRKYGIGTIIIAEGTGIGKTVTVAFKDLGMKKFSVASAPITLV
jgi:DNA helicase-2/ATP-dependent DNA helicase PcrA